MTIDVPRPPERLETDRLVLCPPVPEDAPAMFARWSTDPEATYFLSWRPHTDARQAVVHIERVRAAWAAAESFTWFIHARRTTHGPIGSIASRPGDHGANLGYVLAREVWGRGYMTEAVTAVSEWYLAAGVQRVWATCDPENVGSRRVLEKAGFELEGRLRRWERRPNIDPDMPSDALCYSRVASHDDVPARRAAE